MGNQLTPKQRQWVEEIRNEPRPVLATYYRHTIDGFLRIIDEHFPPPAPEVEHGFLKARGALGTWHEGDERAEDAIRRIRDGVSSPAELAVLSNAADNSHKHPAMTTLIEEFAEAVLAARGKHEHPLRLELVQIAGICINLIRQIDAGETIELRSPATPSAPQEEEGSHVSGT